MPLLVRLLDLYSLVVLVAVILSWVRMDPRNPLVTITRRTHRSRYGADSQGRPPNWEVWTSRR